MEFKKSKYEIIRDRRPCIEKFATLVDSNGNKARVPIPAFNHETGEFVDVNCCLTPWCSNFGENCIAPIPDNDDLTKATNLASGYSFKRVPDYRRPGRIITWLNCISCGYSSRIHSNRSASELMARLTRKYAPALYCQHCSINEHDEAHAKNEYKWDYAETLPHNLFDKHSSTGGKGKNKRTLRVLCVKCKKTQYTTWTNAPTNFWEFVCNPSHDELHMLFDSGKLSVNDFRRSHLYLGNEIQKMPNPRTVWKYYKSIDLYQFIAVEWLGYYNNQIRFGKDVKIEHQIAKRKHKKKRTDSEEDELKHINDFNPVETDETDETDDEEDVLYSFPADIRLGSKKLEFFHTPQIQTDTVILSSHTPGSRSRRQELRLMISVLFPSNHILLATLDYSDEHNLNRLDVLDAKSVSKFAHYEIEGEDRELSMHAHKFKFSDPCGPQSDGKTTRLHVTGFDQRGARIRETYHGYSHYYVLEKIVSKIPKLILVQDKERSSLNTCIWAFRKRIKENTCHVITIQGGYGEMKKGREPSKEQLKEWSDKLQSNVKQKKEEWVRNEAKQGKKGKKHINSHGLPAFYSPLFTRGRDNQKDPKRKIWITMNGLLNMDDLEAAMMLRGASLFVVDSMCNQLRYRVRGLQRGKTKASIRGGQNYVSHWQNPLRIQQLVDIFAFSKNCLTWHSFSENYLPSVVKLNLSERDNHLIHYICNKRILGDEFFFEKYRFTPKKSKEKEHEKG